MTGVLERLAEVIESRRRERPDRSYVVSLLDGGVEAIGAKVVEEAAEFVEAAASADKRPIVHEAADLVFHALVLLAHADVAWSEVEAELERRFGTGGIAEKESRPR